MEKSRVACLGFNGADLALAGQLNAFFMRRLNTNTTFVLVEPLRVAQAFAGRAYRPGDISDTQAVSIGRDVGAQIVMIGRLEARFTETYGEEKKYRMEESFRPSGGATMQIRLDNVPYYEPYIDQRAALFGILRVLDVETGEERRRESVRIADTLHVVLTKPIENPPKEPVVVERITPALADRVVVRLADLLADRFSWRSVALSRQIYRNVQGGEAGLAAVLRADWAQAREIWESMVREAPQNAKAWNNLAVVYEAIGESESALSAYEKALSLAPLDKRILANSRQEE